MRRGGAASRGRALPRQEAVESVPVSSVVQSLQTLHFISLAAMAAPAVLALVLGPMELEVDDRQRAAFVESCELVAGVPQSTSVAEWLGGKLPREIFLHSQQAELCAAAYAAHLRRIQSTLVGVAGLAFLTSQSTPSKAEVHRGLLFWSIAGLMGCASMWACASWDSWLQNKFALLIGMIQASMTIFAVSMYVYVCLHGDAVFSSAGPTSAELGSMEPSQQQAHESAFARFLPSSSAAASSDQEAANLAAFSEAYAVPAATTQAEREFIDGLQANSRPTPAR